MGVGQTNAGEALACYREGVQVAMRRVEALSSNSSGGDSASFLEVKHKAMFFYL